MKPIMIKCTSQYDRIIYINAIDLKCVAPHPELPITNIYIFSQNKPFKVKESPEEIVKQLNS